MYISGADKGVEMGGGGGARGAVAPLHNYWGDLAPLLWNRYSPFYVRRSLCPPIILVFELYP